MTKKTVSVTCDFGACLIDGHWHYSDGLGRVRERQFHQKPGLGAIDLLRKMTFRDLFYFPPTFFTLLFCLPTHLIEMIYLSFLVQVQVLDLSSCSSPLHLVGHWQNNDRSIQEIVCGLKQTCLRGHHLFFDSLFPHLTGTLFAFCLPFELIFCANEHGVGYHYLQCK